MITLDGVRMEDRLAHVHVDEPSESRKGRWSITVTVAASIGGPFLNRAGAQIPVLFPDPRDGAARSGVGRIRAVGRTGDEVEIEVVGVGELQRS
jgi:hypothetical protein